MYDIAYLQQVAKQARQKKKQLEDELKAVSDKMFEAARQGYEVVETTLTLSPDAIEHLRQNGFQVSEQERMDSGIGGLYEIPTQYLSISWFSK